MYVSRLALAKPTSDVAAATDDGDFVDCTVFEANLFIYEKVGGGPPGAMRLRRLSGETVTVSNPHEQIYKATDILTIGQGIDERWSIVNRWEGGQTIRFTAEGPSGADEPASDACADQLYDCPNTFRALVVSRPCGVDRVEGEDDDGYVIVQDKMGDFTENRNAFDLDGKEGIAVLVHDGEQGSSGDECYWLVTWIDWFRQRINVTDVIDTLEEINVKFEKQWVWNHCLLPDIPIETVDCDPGASGGSG